MRLYQTEFFAKNGIVRMVIVADCLEKAVSMMCDKMRRELHPQEMIDGVLMDALRHFREEPIEEGVAFYGHEIIE